MVNVDKYTIHGSYRIDTRNDAIFEAGDTFSSKTPHFVVAKNVKFSGVYPPLKTKIVP